MPLPSLAKLRGIQSELDSLGQVEAAKRIALIVEHYAKLAAVLELQAMPDLEEQLERELEAHIGRCSESLEQCRSTQPEVQARAESLKALREEIDAKIEQESRDLAAELEQLRAQVQSLIAEEQGSESGSGASVAVAAAQMAEWRAEVEQSVRALSDSLERDKKALTGLVEQAKSMQSRLEALESSLAEPPPRKRGLFRRREPSDRL